MSSHSRSTLPADLAGGIVGGVAALLALAVCLLCLRKRRRQRRPSPTTPPSPDPFADARAWDADEQLGDKDETGGTVRDGVLSIPDPAGAEARLSQGLAFAKLALEAEEATRRTGPADLVSLTARSDGDTMIEPHDGYDPHAEVARLLRELDRVRAERDAERAARARERVLANGDIPPLYGADAAAVAEGRLETEADKAHA
jgi:hypothetical protein